MKIERTQEGTVSVLAVEGVIKLGESARQFSEYLESLLAQDVRAVLIDLSSIDYVDSTGLGELVGYLQRFTKEGRRLALLNPHQRILNLLKLTKLDEVFPIFESRTAAVSALAS